MNGYGSHGYGVPYSMQPTQSFEMYNSASYGGIFQPQRQTQSHDAYGVPPQQSLPHYAIDGQYQAPTSRQNQRRINRGSKGIRGAGNTVRNEPFSYEQRVDNVIMSPAFWRAVATALENNVNVADEIRRDLEEQEARVARAREAAAAAARRTTGGPTRARGGGGEPVEGEEERGDMPLNSETDERMDEDGGGGSAEAHVEGDADETVPDISYSQPSATLTESLPDMYEFLARGTENLSRATTGVQSLALLMDELDIGALWSARDVMISFGPLTRVLLRLFVGPYATDEENLIVRMLNLGVERASRNFGFEEYRTPNAAKSTLTATEPLYVTYKRRSRMLRDLAAFKYMLQVAENMSRIDRKHKNDLLLLYITLTTPEVRLHRRWNADDHEQVIAFRDLVSGYTINTPAVMAHPMAIEMHLDSVFGNVSTNTRLLERSLAAALNNRHRRRVANGGEAAVTREVESLLGNARSLDLTVEGVDGVPLPVPSRSDAVKNEHAALRHMLESCVIVSMMAEEYRVFVAGAPTSRSGGVGKGGGARANRRSAHNVGTNITAATVTTGGGTAAAATASTGARSTMFRRPIFFTFKPTSQAVATL